MSNGIASTQNLFASYGGLNKPADTKQIRAISAWPANITQADVGKVISLPAPGAAVVLNLPAPAQCPGGSLDLVCTATIAAGHSIAITAPAAGGIRGYVGTSDGRVSTNASITLTVNAGAVAGSRYSFISDGTVWVLSGTSTAASAVNVFA